MACRAHSGHHPRALTTACACACAPRRYYLLTTRLEATLKELQATIHERDRLSSTLEEALSRCTSSLVARQLAEDDCKAMQHQLDVMRELTVQ